MDQYKDKMGDHSYVSSGVPGYYGGYGSHGLYDLILANQISDGHKDISSDIGENGKDVLHELCGIKQQIAENKFQAESCCKDNRFELCQTEGRLAEKILDSKCSLEKQVAECCASIRAEFAADRVDALKARVKELEDAANLSAIQTTIEAEVQRAIDELAV